MNLKTNLFVFFCIIALFSSCMNRQSPAKDKIKIGLSMDSFVVERWVRDRDIFVSEAQNLGAQVLVQVANQDHDTQVSQINMLLQQNVNVLVVIANDSRKLGPVIRQIREKGIPVISYDRLIFQGNASLYIAHDHVMAGKLMAQALVDKLSAQKKLGRIIIMNGADSDYNTILMNKGYHEILDPLAADNKLKIIDEEWIHSWSSEEADILFRKSLAKTTGVNGLIAADDMLAESLIRVLAQQSLLDSVAVTGMDADLAACQRVVEGTQLMTVYKPILPLAKAAAQYAVDLALGKPITSTETINDGQFNIPYVKLAPIEVTKKNMTEVVVKSGFHRQEEIYRNRDIR